MRHQFDWTIQTQLELATPAYRSIQDAAGLLAPQRDDSSVLSEGWRHVLATKVAE